MNKTTEEYKELVKKRAGFYNEGVALGLSHGKACIYMYEKMDGHEWEPEKFAWLDDNLK